MAEIALAKALKLKNRLAGRLAKVESDVRQHNSVLVEQKGKVDVTALLELRDQIASEMVSLKTNIIIGNAPIQRDLIFLGELKARLAWLQTIPTRDGSERHGYQNTEVTYVAEVTKKAIDADVKKMEAEIDAIQDKIDAYNHTTKIVVSELALNLAS